MFTANDTYRHVVVRLALLALLALLGLAPAALASTLDDANGQADAPTAGEEAANPLVEGGAGLPSDASARQDPAPSGPEAGANPKDAGSGEPEIPAGNPQVTGDTTVDDPSPATSGQEEPPAASPTEADQAEADQAETDQAALGGENGASSPEPDEGAPAAPGAPENAGQETEPNGETPDNPNPGETPTSPADGNLETGKPEAGAQPQAPSADALANATEAHGATEGNAGVPAAASNPACATSTPPCAPVKQAATPKASASAKVSIPTASAAKAPATATSAAITTAAAAKPKAKTSSGSAASKSANPAIPLKAGTYVIVAAKTAGAVLDAFGGSTAKGTNIELFGWNGGKNQKWKLTVDKRGRYTITGVQSGRALAVKEAKSKANAALGIGSTATRRWILKPSGSFFLICPQGNQDFALGTSGGKTADGSNLALYSAKGAGALKFYFIPTSAKVKGKRTVADGVYTLGAASSAGRKIGVAGSSSRDSANITSQKGNGTLAQKWVVSYTGNGLYRLTNINSGRALDVEDARILARTNVIQYGYHGTANQLWSIAENADGTFTLRSSLSGMALEVAGGSKSNGANVRVNYPKGTKAQRFSLKTVNPMSEGTYQLFSRLDQTGKALDVSGVSLANGGRIVLWTSTDAPNQHFIIKRAPKGSQKASSKAKADATLYTIQSVSSGKYLTARSGKVVQASAKKTKAGQAASQLWQVAYRGGFTFRNVADSKYLAVAGDKSADGTQAITRAWKGTKGQKYRLASRQLISDGIYELGSAANTSLKLDVEGGSFKNGANLELWTTNGNNNQKFRIEHVKGGYYHLSMLLTDSSADISKGSKKQNANALMWDTSDKAAWQLWKPEVTDGGLVFVNKNSGKALSAAKAKSGANVRQSTRASSKLQKWAVGSTSINLTDVDSFLNCIAEASGSASLKLSNGAAGWSVDEAKWRELQRAINSCGFGIGFIMTDCSTGMTLSYNPDRVFYGASTIKALWTTYLFEEYLAKGRLSWGRVSGLVVPTIVQSNNETYLSLREGYGSESGFSSWLGRSRVGYIPVWGYYSPRTLQKTWTHMLAYGNSSDSHVGTWKSTFNHSYMSAIHDGLSGKRTTYSKPGWMSDILDDSAVVVGEGGRQYLLTVMTSAGPGGKGQVQRVVRAIDDIQASMPAER